MGNICASTPRTADTTSVDRKIKKPAKKELKAEMRLAGEQSAKVTTSSKEVSRQCASNAFIVMTQAPPHFVFGFLI